MPTTSIETIVKDFRMEYGIHLSKLPSKKIIYQGKTKNSSSVVVAMPTSKIHARGHGWVDLTKIQTDLFKEYKLAVLAFRISDGNTYYIDFNNLTPLMHEGNMMVNDREGEHWKLYIWPNKIVLRNGGDTLYVKPNDKSHINQIMRHENL